MKPDAGLEIVRSEVLKVLGASPAWERMSTGDRQTFAENMMKVGAYLSKDPGWLDAALPPGAEGLAEALGPIDELKGRLAKEPGQVGQTFKAGAMRQGVEEFANLVKTVDFPEFVGGLIHGVFQAIVDASIQQMEAFGELLAATAKSVGQFANDHITDDQARQQIASRYPSVVRIERSEESGANRLAAVEGADDLTPLKSMVPSHETISLSDDTSERKFITAAKLEMARGRQKLMALMVLLGINRIVVTNGRINAKVVFDIRASDYAKRLASAGLTDKDETDAAVAAATWQPWGAAGGYARTHHTTTVRSSIDDTSESKAEMKARLSGEVRVNFKSETLPPERMLDALQMEQMNYLAQPGGPAPGAAASGPQAGSAPAPAAGTPGGQR